MVHDIRRKTEIKELYDRYVSEWAMKNIVVVKTFHEDIFRALYKI